MNLHKNHEFEIYKEVGKGLIALANFSVGALLFSQIFSDSYFSIPIGVLGLFIFSICYIFSIKIMKGKILK